MSWKALNWATDQATGSASNKLILITLANFADDSGVCFPKISTMSKISELSERQIIRCIKDLKDRGFLTVIRQYREDRTRTANIYQLGGQNGANEKSNMTQCHMGNTPFVTLQHDTMSLQEPSLEPPLEPSRVKSELSVFDSALTLLSPLKLKERDSRALYGRLRKLCNKAFDTNIEKDSFLIEALKNVNVSNIAGEPYSYLQAVVNSRLLKESSSTTQYGLQTKSLTVEEVLQATPAMRSYYKKHKDYEIQAFLKKGLIQAEQIEWFN